MRSSVVLLALLVACKRTDDGADDEKPAAATVTCTSVEAASIDDTVDVSGVIAPPPKVDAIVGSPIAGRIARITVEEGDRVAAGDVVAVIADPSLVTGEQEAGAAVASAKAAKAAADQELARQERLVTAGIAARKQLEDARAKAVTAAAELDAANARSHFAANRMARREVRSPIAGVVLHVTRKLGELVDGSSSTPIAEIADLSVLELHAQVPPSALEPVRENMAATVRVLGSDAPIAATVYRVSPAVDPTTLLGMVRVRLDNDPPLKVGTMAVARIVVAKRSGVRVPASALRRSLVGDDEVVVCDHGVAHVRTVAVGNRDEHGVELKDGVKANEQVVTDHVLGLEEGQQLVPAQGAR